MTKKGADLIFVFAYAKRWFSHDAAQMFIFSLHFATKMLTLLFIINLSIYSVFRYDLTEF